VLVTADARASEARDSDAAEFIHYYTNLLRLFRGKRPLEQIERDARAAAALRDARIRGFAMRLDSARRHFELSRGDERFSTALNGWDMERIQRMRRDHGGLLIAVFHYGEHRHVLSDLCCLGVPFVAPVAKRSYFDATAIFAGGPPDCAAAPMLLEVERADVGRQLVAALRRGRIGVIYVDGNMGPDGHLVEESATEINFLGESIRVKSGVARLAIALGLPILPMIAVPRAELPMVATDLHAFPEILPTSGDRDDREHRVRTIMQRCYDALATAVIEAPEHWEFSLCLHRWLHPDACTAGSTPGLSHGETLAVDPSMVVHYPRTDGLFWLHVGRQRGFRLPHWSADLYAFLSRSPRSHAQVVAHLRARGAPAEDIAELIAQLHAADLVDVHASIDSTGRISCLNQEVP
jgi:hypothetical protein